MNLEWERSTTELPMLGEIVNKFEKQQTSNTINKTTFMEKVVLTPINATEANKTTTDVKPINDISSEEQYGHKEPTTERSTTKGYTDIDNDYSSTISSDDGQVSPKDEVESIKVSDDTSMDASLTSQDVYEAKPVNFFSGALQDWARALPKVVEQDQDDKSWLSILTANNQNEGKEKEDDDDFLSKFSSLSF